MGHDGDQEIITQESQDWEVADYLSRMFWDRGTAKPSRTLGPEGREPRGSFS